MGNYRVVIQKPTEGANGVNSFNSRVGEVVPVSGDYTTGQVLEVTDKKYITDAEKIVIGNTSNTNTGDETTATIQTKRLLKTVGGESLEGAGNIDLPDNGVQSVTGDGVGGTAEDVVLSFPNADEVDDSSTTNKFATGTNTGDETTGTIQTKRPLKTINGDSLEGIGNIITTNETLIVEGTIEDTNTLNAVSGNAVYEKLLQDRFQFSNLYDRSLPLRPNFRYGGILGIDIIPIGTPSADINTFDLYLRYFRNNGSGALVQIVTSDLTPIAQLNRPSVLQTGIEKANLVQLNGFEYIFNLEFDWDSVQNYYDGDLGITVKLDTEKGCFLIRKLLL